MRQVELTQYPVDLQSLPATWSAVCVGDAIPEIHPGFPCGNHNSAGTGVIHLRPMNVDRQGRLDLSVVKYVPAENPARIVRGEILFNNTNSPELIGKTTYISIDGDFAFSNHMTRLKPPSEVDAKFVAYQLHFLWMVGYFLHRCTHHVNQASIASGTLAETVPLIIPPQNEQRRIVEEIEKQFTRLDAAVAALKRVQANLKRYRAAVLKAACEGRLVPTEAEISRREGRAYEPAAVLLDRILADRRAKWEGSAKAKHKEPSSPNHLDLASVPEGWANSRMEQLAQVGTGATPLRSNKTYWDGGTIPWITSGALNERTVGQALELVTDKALKETNLTVYPPGTLLVAMYGEGKTRGKCAELEIEAATNQAIAALQLEAEGAHCRQYVRIFMEKNYEDVRRQSSGGVQPNLNLSLIRGIVVPLPPLAEQMRIATEWERLHSVISEIEIQVDADLRRAHRLRQSILKRAFEGKLVEQDPSDEPASVLLERIRGTAISGCGSADEKGKKKSLRKKR